MLVLLGFSFSFARLIVWLLVGALAGYAVGAVVRRRKEGFGTWGNLGVGLVGAAIGGFLHDILGLDMRLGAISVSLEDVVSALIGSVLFLVILAVARRRGKKAKPPAA